MVNHENDPNYEGQNKDDMDGVDYSILMNKAGEPEEKKDAPAEPEVDEETLAQIDQMEQEYRENDDKKTPEYYADLANKLTGQDNIQPKSPEAAQEQAFNDSKEEQG